MASRSHSRTVSRTSSRRPSVSIGKQQQQEIECSVNYAGDPRAFTKQFVRCLTPVSKLACDHLGVDVEELVYTPRSFFVPPQNRSTLGESTSLTKADIVPDEVIDLRFKNAEVRRQGLLKELRQYRILLLESALDKSSNSTHEPQNDKPGAGTTPAAATAAPGVRTSSRTAAGAPQFSLVGTLRLGDLTDTGKDASAGKQDLGVTVPSFGADDSYWVEFERKKMALKRRHAAEMQILYEKAKRKNELITKHENNRLRREKAFRERRLEMAIKAEEKATKRDQLLARVKEMQEDKQYDKRVKLIAKMQKQAAIYEEQQQAIRQSIAQMQRDRQGEDLKRAERVDQLRVEEVSKKWDSLMKTEKRLMRAAPTRLENRQNMVAKKIQRNIKLTKAFRQARGQLLDEQASSYAAFLRKASQHRDVMARKRKEDQQRIQDSKQRRRDKEATRDRILRENEEALNKKRKAARAKMNRELSEEWKQKREAELQQKRIGRERRRLHALRGAKNRERAEKKLAYWQTQVINRAAEKMNRVRVAEHKRDQQELQLQEFHKRRFDEWRDFRKEYLHLKTRGKVKDVLRKTNQVQQDFEQHLRDEAARAEKARKTQAERERAAADLKRAQVSNLSKKLSSAYR